MTWLNSMKSEYMKQRRSMFITLSLGVPVLVASVLALYFKVRADMFNKHLSFLMFFEVVAVGTPLVISIFSSMLIQQEENAGHFKNLLGISRSKLFTLTNKVIFMIFGYAVSLLVAVVLYYSYLYYWVGYEMEMAPYLLNIINFVICAVFQYFFYCAIAYRFGSGPTTIIGLGGLVITALSFTSLGDRVWMFLPWAWSHRISLYLYGNIERVSSLNNYLSFSQFLIALMFIVIVTSSMIIFFLTWAKKWEGKTSS